ncbi:MAG: hypothetical protein AB1730_02720 [Myxococcota bacterium]
MGSNPARPLRAFQKAHTDRSNERTSRTEPLSAVDNVMQTSGLKRRHQEQLDGARGSGTGFLDGGEFQLRAQFVLVARDEAAA